MGKWDGWILGVLVLGGLGLMTELAALRGLLTRTNELLLDLRERLDRLRSEVSSLPSRMEQSSEE